ncbi:hypothetical protein P5673_002082 [Acropora cervicornis]|uniref:Uncharacterized protein n=1 Tax=Acropora cervicornis TaxID=6130 RepID=A0AAD9R5B8_ACRCE|nr:hypothetical protein P5673_002082 [Acropora cervicornis]
MLLPCSTGLQRLSSNPELQRQRLNVRQYWDNNMLHLKSKHDFNAAYDVVLSAGLGDYMRKFAAIQPGAWPCQFYCRQII